LSGEWWRVLTGHFTHWNLDHAMWDVLMFVALGALCESRWPRRFAVCTAASALAISLAIFYGQPDVELYRGLSGIDSALFTLAVWGLLEVALAHRRFAGMAALTTLLLGLIGKIMWEYATGATIFVDSTAEFVPIPLAHLVGASVGLLTAMVGCAVNWWRADGRPSHRLPNESRFNTAALGQRDPLFFAR
jgi:rhomboid family GlyGly-CTERM serine protease